MPARQQKDLRLRLKHEVALLAALERHLVLAQRLGVVALAAEREAEVVAGELPFARDLQLALGIGLRRRTIDALMVDREIRVRARQRRVELNRASRDCSRIVVPAQVAEHEAHEIQRVVVLRIQLHRALELRERLGRQAAMVEHFAQRPVQQRALGVELERPLEERLRLLDVARLLFGERELQQRADVVRAVLQHRAKLLRGLGLLAEQRERAAKLPPRVAIVGAKPDALFQLGNAGVVVAGVEVRDLEIALRDLHLRVELERLHERGDGLLVESLVVVQDPQVVVRAGVRRIDPPGERPEHVAVAL